MPINEAQSYHGYDPINLYSIEKDYGDFNDFKFMINKLHLYGIRVILDLVINHTSDKIHYLKMLLKIRIIQNTGIGLYYLLKIIQINLGGIGKKIQKVRKYGILDFLILICLIIILKTMK